MDIFDILFGAVGGAAAALGIARLMFENLLKLQLDKELERFKTELEQKSAVLKTELSIYAHEQNVGLTRIDAQRSNAILAIWSLLGEWQDTLLEVVAPNHLMGKAPVNAIQHYFQHSRELMVISDRLSVEVRNRTLFFDESSYHAIAKYGQTISEVTNNFYAATVETIDVSQITDHNAFLEKIDSARDALRNGASGDAKSLRDSLVKEFRVLMKVNSTMANPALQGMPLKQRS